jgi:tetratricopeptide (TPR) repeat protein
MADRPRPISGRIFFFIIIFSLFSSLIYAQRQVEQPWWYTLEQGKRAFRSASYGDALLNFEDARRQRRQMYTRLETEFITLLSLPEVRRLGDSLELVEGFIKDRNYGEAEEALRELYYRVPRSSLNNSAQAALTGLGRLKDYPEAEYWIGETYRSEGELGIAVNQYQKALAQRHLFENPGLELELLYKTAELRRARREYPEMEKTLLGILSDIPAGGETPRDSLWNQDSGTFAKQAMTRTLERDGFSRFLTLYRYNNRDVEKAHRLLGFFFYSSGRHSSAPDHLMFAFLIQNSLIIEELIRNRFDFSFSSLDDLMEELKTRPNLLRYIEEVEYYKTAYYLAASLYAAGKAVPARELWTFLSRQAGAGEWAVRSTGQLERPYIERPLENW